MNLSDYNNEDLDNQKKKQNLSSLSTDVNPNQQFLDAGHRAVEEKIKNSPLFRPERYFEDMTDDDYIAMGRDSLKESNQRTFGGTLKDIAITGAKGVVGVGESVVGLADIPTFGYVGKGMEKYLGYDPEKTQEMLYGQYSPAQKEAFENVSQAKGFIPTIKESIKNPSTIGHAILESAPQMLGGAAAAKKLLSSGLLKMTPTWSKVISSAMGEGLVSAGASAESVRQQTDDGLLTPKQAAISVASGIGTGLFSVAGGRVAEKFGFADPDTFLAGGSNVTKTGIIKRILGGGISEGAFEELPQSMQEQVWLNAALDKPLLDGVGEAGATGLLSGMTMGAGFNVFTGDSATKTGESSIDAEKNKQIDAQAENIISNGPEVINNSLIQIDKDLTGFNTLLNNPEALEAKAVELNMPIEELTASLNDQINISMQLQERLMTETKLTEPEVVPENIPEQDIIPQDISPSDEFIQRGQPSTAEESAMSFGLHPSQSPAADSARIFEREGDIISNAQRERQQVINKTYLPAEQELDAFERQEREKNNINQDQLKELSIRLDRFSREDKIELQKLKKGKLQIPVDINIESPTKNDKYKIEMAKDFIDTATEKLGGKLAINIVDQYGRPIESAGVKELSIGEKRDRAAEYIAAEIKDQIEKKKVIADEDTAFRDWQRKAGDKYWSIGLTEDEVFEQWKQEANRLRPKDIVMSNMAMSPIEQEDRRQAEIEVDQEKRIAEPRRIDTTRRKHIDEMTIDEMRTELKTSHLTGLGNKRAYEESVKKPIQVSIDVDSLKWTNDNFGHESGDELLKVIGRAFEGNSDAFHVSGDEFLFQSDTQENVDNAIQKANDYLDKNPIDFVDENGNIISQLNGSFSYGTGKTATEADIALRKSKTDREVSGDRAARGEKPTGFKEIIPEGETGTEAITEPNIEQFELRQNQTPGQGIQVEDIQKIFPEQNVFINDKKQISINLKNGKGIIFENIKNAGDNFIEYAVQTGQMSKNDKILGITLGNKILLDSEFADNKTLWHENKHALDNLGIVTKEDDSALNKEFNKLRKLDKLQFELSTHENSIQRMKENRANMFAQIMTSREEYRNTSFGKLVQKVMDFFNQLYIMGRRVVTGNQEFQTTSGLARETESGKLYERTTDGLTENTNLPQFTYAGAQASSADKSMLNKAIELEQTGVDNESIRKETGWFLGMDDKWRFEIDDRKTEWNIKGLVTQLKSKFGIPLTLKNVFKHPELYKAYPELKNVNFELKKLPKGVKASHNSKTNKIELSSVWIDNLEKKGDVQKEVKKTLVHELQHAIQRIEGFAKGGKPTLKNTDIGTDLTQKLNTFKELMLKQPDQRTEKETESYLWLKKNMPKLKKLVSEKAHDQYRRLAGEIEARDVSARMDWDKKDRENIAPYKTQGILKKDAIVHFNKDVSLEINELLDEIKPKWDKDNQSWKFEVKGMLQEIYRDPETGWWMDAQRLTPGTNRPLYLGDLKTAAIKKSIELTNKNLEELFKDVSFEMQEPLSAQEDFNEQHLKRVQEKESLLKKIQQSTKMKTSEVKLMLEKSLTPISTRLKNIGLEGLSAKLQILDFKTSGQITEALKEAYPMMKKAKKMSPNDRTEWDSARKNSDVSKITQLAQKYDIEDNYNNVRETLNQIREDAIDVGFDVGFVENYWPRVLKDQKGFLQATQEISHRPIFTDAIKQKADKLGITTTELEQRYPDLKADIISNTILGGSSGIGGPGNIQGRVFETIPEEYAKFYMDSDAALMQYIYSMTKKIEARRFFGKVPQQITKVKQRRNLAQTEVSKLEELRDLTYNDGLLNDDKQKLIESHNKRIDLLQENIKDYDIKLEEYKNQRDYTENIGAYINDLMLSGELHKKDEQTVRDILDARFHEKGTTGIVHKYKNISYIDVMGNPMAAVTQIGDSAWGMYVGEIWNPLRLPSNIKNLTKAIFKKSNISKEDLGIDRMAQEFADSDSLSNLVSKVFKGVGLERIDSIGKEFLINNAFDAYKRQANSKNGRIELMKKLKPIFGNGSNKVINELLALSKDSTADPSENIKMLLYSRLLDFQPVALSEMPENYLKGGNWRILYMLKTFTIKQLDVFRNEVWKDLKTGNTQQKLSSIKRMVQLMGVLALANAGADEIKDFMMGKETKFSDTVIENFLTMGGANRFVRMQARREGLGTTIGQMILPPFKLVDSLSKDVFSGEIADIEKSRTLESLPFIGKLAYWNIGRGSEYRPSIEKQDFDKKGKEFRKFKKVFEETNDKRLFLQTNADDFKQMKIYENFSKPLKKITVLINKLEKLEQTTNVRKRIGQLTESQNQLMQRYFDIIKNKDIL